MTKKLIYGAMCAMLSAAMTAMSCSNDNDNYQDFNTSEDNSGSYTPENSNDLGKAQVSAKSQIAECDRPANYNEFLSKLNKFASSLDSKVVHNNEENFAVSPLSIFMVMAMATECSNGATNSQLLDALGMTKADLDANMKYLCYEANRTLGYAEGTNGNLIKAVNSIWANKDVDLSDNCMGTLSGSYYTDLFRVDFVNDNSSANSLLTSYIKNETKGFLSDINLDAPTDTRMILMNVLYLKDLWKDSGDLQYTEDKYGFTNSNGSVTSTKMLMGDYEMGKAIETEKYKKFYTTTNGGITLTFIVPNDGYTVSDIYTADALNATDDYDYGSETLEYKTRCIFPEFTASYNDDIKGILQQMGVSDLFVAGTCDFSNLTSEDVFCGTLKHITKLEVSKTGIEGAAITAMMMCTSAMPVETVHYDFVVDKAFVYIISDYNAGQIFTGVVNKI